MALGGRQLYTVHLFYSCRRSKSGETGAAILAFTFCLNSHWEFSGYLA